MKRAQVGQIAGAGAEVESHPAQASRAELGEKALDVDRMSASLEAVEEDDARCAGRAVEVVEDQLVSVRKSGGLPAEAGRGGAAGSAVPEKVWTCRWPRAAPGSNGGSVFTVCIDVALRGKASLGDRGG